MDISQQELLHLFAVGRLEILGISADQLGLLKMKIFSREYTASVLPFLSQTTLQLRIFACSVILNQIQRAFLFLLLASIEPGEH